MPKANDQQLWKVHRKMSSDSWDFGGMRQHAKVEEDCSTCKFFHKIEGHDCWGVCFNSVSRRAGLLTFEAIGCEYLQEEEK